MFSNATSTCVFHVEHSMVAPPFQQSREFDFNPSSFNWQKKEEMEQDKVIVESLENSYLMTKQSEECEEDQEEVFTQLEPRRLKT